ncbi:cytochrome P450 family protein [Hypoxylon trugodes]|uniref:cytochrome P450 family protein n=1 Tax=Hypoxylon trugodes TaxID=326681 RepID=UPI00218F334F|nr:cytochrome P450 family protein [Hypoxylon trugodes]KAI1382876.1 cytochrome P450 family protein [Hypoxylon trugodes]
MNIVSRIHCTIMAFILSTSSMFGPGVATAILLVSYILSIAFYRLFLSPLAKIPGPKLAALTYWYECYYDVFRPAQYVFKIKELHRVYGPIIRITPAEVSIADPDFVDAIYSPGPGQKRDKDIQKVKALGINTSIGGAVAHDLHRHRREALNPFFSHRSITRLAPKMDDKVGQLEDLFLRAKESTEVVNLSDLYYGFANDILNEYCFGRNENLVSDKALAHAKRENVNGVLRAVKFNLHFSWVRDLMRRLPPSIGAKMTPPGIRDMIRFRIGIRKEIQAVVNQKTKGRDEGATKSIFHELRDSSILPESEKSPQRLEDEATLLVMAGTQSTQLSLTMAHYHLLANPAIMAKLRTELASHPSSTLIQLEQLPYLNGVIQEAHRLAFGLTGRNARVSPDQPVDYTDLSTGHTYVIPSGTSISTSTLLVHANEDIFPDPFVFNPERWLGSAGLVRRKYQLTFSKGPRTCIGMHLANAEMAVAIAAMARWDMKLFETENQDVEFLHDYHVATPKLDSKGVRVTVASRVA